ncbi:hypothetical protein A2962_00665 [Candidatus Woesebacteria bacterium RIFCSPLOWO2_01_FULL_39_61]|uniref:Methyltransferase type 11 domain-containing protein n=1 Tax=Candidatus Woesebacteria bacterium RIFCSPHIGHO2_02_FULL_39_13 TaxID=1802505 RepID=A0A1F7Z3B0_9BACT|nr:MAG: hypothetical protein A2692_04795 [Candidatus Woesebacteria bacterium RIFCSPHIGHO2_01_FULL_39_95]OGM33579.1 MAG: hypothetical protein A3D01_01330 [Candidatus Woesebacteria bacterium RIFCSPHIGHO2_02_FULL_39_13]OGM36691.1 MAG: hypothetical protein A3E13_00160 [Candidatus Woesebacteria bacterium RIFCSPHIGHO2_12_FULL_40_20]OGM68564.1 MAG: hypothetical protein A2962_00665 [Candidatus Woesebacteria bacterium RIFCSPLOWO2_01_FULL_39_61]OGM75035.1 MAG: hypothetical protein A3H19_02120 [Candidatus
MGKKFKEVGIYLKSPQEDIPKITNLLKKSGLNKVLDLGCGTGRNLIFMAQNGLSVYGLDNSKTAIKLTKRWLRGKKLKAKFILQDMGGKLPFKDNFFDAVVSVQVIHHAKIEEIRKIVREIERVLKMQGLIFVTVPKFKNQGSSFKKIEPNTSIPLDGSEKGLPHHYFTKDELKSIFKNFSIADIHLDKTNHYCLLGYRN